MVADMAMAKQKKYLVWACSFKPLIYPIEYNEVAIQRVDARMPNKRPKASTLNCNESPGARETIVYSIIFP